MSVWSAVKGLFNGDAAKQLTGYVVNTSKKDTFGVKGPISSPLVPNVGSSSQQLTPMPKNQSSPGMAGSVFPSVFGALTSGVSNIVGGILSSKAQKEQNEIAERQFAEQMAFAKDQYYNAVQNRLVDAKKAGVHPLAALGVQPHGSASPTVHGQAATGLGQALQGLSGAVNSYFDNAQRAYSMELAAANIAATRAQEIKSLADAGRSIADTDYTRKEIANYNVYRVWNSINNSLGSVTRLVSPFRVNKTYNIDNNQNYWER